MSVCGGGRKGQASESRGARRDFRGRRGEERAGSGVPRVLNIFPFRSGTALLEKFPWCSFTAMDCRSLFFALPERYSLSHIS